MDKTTQTVLCCIGESVAGEPTQFVMQRAFSSRELDWQVLTVQVSLEELPDALAGAQAMKFAALRIYGNYDRAVLEHLNVSNSPDFVGTVTSAKRTSNGWEAWHATGFGILGAAEQIFPLDDSHCLIAEDNLVSRSFLAALLTSRKKCQLTFGSSFPLDEAAQNLVSELQANGCNIETSFELDALDFQNMLVLGEASEACDLSSFEQLAESQLLVVGDVEHASAWGIQDRTKVLSQLEIMSYSHAYDFERWTGDSTDVSLFRDAIEEYSEF